jgi:hypothetical protein
MPCARLVLRAAALNRLRQMLDWLYAVYSGRVDGNGLAALSLF